jgi:23S rRNA (uridine2552-2'-O)-methyltransferase
VIALDILDMDPIDDVTFIRGDFTEDGPLEGIIVELSGGYADLVISDMAPNLSGVKDIDQPRAMYLVELAIELADRVLARGGSLVAKCFEGEGIDDIRTAYRERFEKVHNFKPRASRGKSREIYVIGSGHTSEPVI